MSAFYHKLTLRSTSSRIVVGPQGEVSEEFLIRAVNCHEDLLAACEAALLALHELARYAGDVPEWNEGGWAHEACQSLRKAIEKARPAP